MSNRLIGVEVFFTRARAKHGDRYDYSKTNYRRLLDRIEIICPEHGSFFKRATRHLDGQGCPHCSVGGTHTRWSQKEDAFLREHYQKRGAAWCAKELGRKPMGATNRASALGLTKVPRPPLNHPHIPGHLWHNLEGGAKARGLSVKITPDDVWEQYRRQEGCCALTGWSVAFGVRGLTTASIDRIDSSKGYFKDNIQIVHKIVNRAKWDSTDEAFYGMCAAIARHRPDLLERREEWVWNHWHDTEQPEHQGTVKSDYSEEAIFGPETPPIPV